MMERLKGPQPFMEIELVKTIHWCRRRLMGFIWMLGRLLWVRFLKLMQLRSDRRGLEMFHFALGAEKLNTILGIAGGLAGGGGRHAGQGSRKQDLIEFVAPLCATQVDGQAFFLIPSRSCEVNARERVNTSIV
jgi:hypothetical protein